MQNLFHSVSLNVNNPHFLIMQGRITKVRMVPSSAVGRCEARRKAPGLLLLCRPAPLLHVSCTSIYSASTQAPSATVAALIISGNVFSECSSHTQPADPVLRAQVLNMKPPEILGMLEEAAGTRMYENKKDAALRTLEKKQVKVAEIEKVCRVALCMIAVLDPRQHAPLSKASRARQGCRADHC